MKIIALLLGFCMPFLAYAGNTLSTKEKETLLKLMLNECKTELAQDPTATDLTDVHAVWKNIEVKEYGEVKLSTKCFEAHRVYEEKKFHVGKEN